MRYVARAEGRDISGADPTTGTKPREHGQGRIQTKGGQPCVLNAPLPALPALRAAFLHGGWANQLGGARRPPLGRSQRRTLFQPFGRVRHDLKLHDPLARSVNALFFAFRKAQDSRKILNLRFPDAVGSQGPQGSQSVSLAVFPTRWGWFPFLRPLPQAQDSREFSNLRFPGAGGSQVPQGSVFRSVPLVGGAGFMA